MDYKSKYIQYKNKYLNLKKQQYGQIGGAHTTIPSTYPRTYSFLYMPLIYYTIDSSSVQLFDGFRELLQECIDILTAELDPKPFTDVDGFFTYLRSIINSNGVNTIEDLERLKDSDHHIPGDEQDRIMNYKTDELIHNILTCLVFKLIPDHAGKTFNYI